MKYNCDICNYSTDDGSNFRRHLKSSFHNLNETKHIEKNINENEEKYTCECGKKYSCKQSLSRHRQQHNSNDKEIKNLQNQVAELTVKLDTIQSKGLTNNINNINNGTINNTYITVKTYVTNNYPDAPSLIKFNEYNKFESKQDETNPLANILAYHYRKYNIDKYLGDFIIECYKKDDPSKQSVWSSDISRLNYVVKELLGKKSLWSKDEKGEKIKEYIVNPFLQHIYDTCAEYFDDYKEKHPDVPGQFEKMYGDKCVEMSCYFYNINPPLARLQEDITNGILADNIVKYIAPAFRLEKELTDDKINKDICKTIKYEISELDESNEKPNNKNHQVREVEEIIDDDQSIGYKNISFIDSDNEEFINNMEINTRKLIGKPKFNNNKNKTVNRKSIVFITKSKE